MYKRQVAFETAAGTGAAADSITASWVGDKLTFTITGGTISVDLSGYLKADEISEWAKAENKAAYTLSLIHIYCRVW